MTETQSDRQVGLPALTPEFLQLAAANLERMFMNGINLTDGQLKVVNQSAAYLRILAARDAAEGATLRHHGIQCALCGETLHDNEICDDAECPIGGSFTVHPSATGAAGPVADRTLWKWENIAEAAYQRARLTDAGAAAKLRSAFRAIIEAGLAAAPPVRGEALPLKELLNERDSFIVSKGLWSEFTDNLKAQPGAGETRQGVCTACGGHGVVRIPVVGGPYMSIADRESHDSEGEE